MHAARRWLAVARRPAAPAIRPLCYQSLSSRTYPGKALVR